MNLKEFFLSENKNALDNQYISCISNDFRPNLNVKNISLPTFIGNFLAKLTKNQNFQCFFAKKTNQNCKKTINDTDFLFSADP